VAVARPHPISLKLSRSGYKIIALDNAGHAVEAAGLAVSN
jgi:hypothetical protein